MNRPPLPVIAAIAIALLLGACSAPAGLAAFQRDATAADQLPAGPDTPGTPKMENTRVLAEADGVRYYAAQTDSSAVTCLVKVPGDGTTGFVAGCGSSMVTGQIVTVSGADGSAATLVTDGFDTKELEAAGWRKLQENVLIGRR
ncbi:hypothetical protein [Arthrobacter sp. UYCu712]|uniref:hypothetical protein n=1 Tax=Arthrobacter sp. UYCu712 TaxID=3156340 RepID=UPI003394452E